MPIGASVVPKGLVDDVGADVSLSGIEYSGLADNQTWVVRYRNPSPDTLMMLADDIMVCSGDVSPCSTESGMARGELGAVQ